MDGSGIRTDATPHNLIWIILQKADGSRFRIDIKPVQPAWSDPVAEIKHFFVLSAFYTIKKDTLNHSILKYCRVNRNPKPIDFILVLFKKVDSRRVRG